MSPRPVCIALVVEEVLSCRLIGQRRMRCPRSDFLPTPTLLSMRNCNNSRTLVFVGLVAVLAASPHSLARAGTAFSYQGQLALHGAPVNSICNMQFRLFNNSLGGSLLDTIGPTDVSVANGVFTTVLDFGAEQLGTGDRWLEISVDCGTGLIQLSPRQPLLAAPYAVHSRNTATPRIRAFEFKIKATDWSGHELYGGNSTFRKFVVPASLTGGTSVSEWYRAGGSVVAYARPGPVEATRYMTFMRPLPMAYNRANDGANLGFRIDFIPNQDALPQFAGETWITISGTSNGWNNTNIAAADIPQEVDVRIMVTDPN